MVWPEAFRKKQGMVAQARLVLRLAQDLEPAETVLRYPRITNYPALLIAPH